MKRRAMSVLGRDYDAAREVKVIPTMVDHIDQS